MLTRQETVRLSGLGGPRRLKNPSYPGDDHFVERKDLSKMPLGVVPGVATTNFYPLASTQLSGTLQDDGSPFSNLDRCGFTGPSMTGKSMASSRYPLSGAVQPQIGTFTSRLGSELSFSGLGCTPSISQVIEAFLSPKYIVSCTYPATIREELWQTLLHAVSQRNTKLACQISSCLSILEVYWGIEGYHNISDIMQLVFNKQWEKSMELAAFELQHLPFSEGSAGSEFFVLVVSPVFFSRPVGNNDFFFASGGKGAVGGINGINNVVAELEILSRTVGPNHQNGGNGGSGNRYTGSGGAVGMGGGFGGRDAGGEGSCGYYMSKEYSIVNVHSAEDALIAVLVNPDIIAVVICDNIPIFSNDRGGSDMNDNLTSHLGISKVGDRDTGGSGMNSAWTNLFGFDESSAKSYLKIGLRRLIEEPIQHMLSGSSVLTTLVEGINACRSELDIYTVCSNTNLMGSCALRSLVRRCFVALEDHAELHDAIISGVKTRKTSPFFDSLVAYAERPIGVFHALAISRGNSVRQSRWIHRLGRFYGYNLFKAESSATCGGLDSLLDPHGALKDAQKKASDTFGAQFLFFTTNGTSTSNKIVVQALTKPGDVVLVDRACHKSHHYALVLQGARPCYLEPYALQDYSIFGGVPLETMKSTLLAYKMAGRLHEISLLILTNCTFDGIVYNVQRVMEECLAIKPDLCFLFDEAWFAYAFFHPVFKYRTGMNSATVIRRKLQAGYYDAPYRALCDKLGVTSLSEVKDPEILLNHRLYPDPSEAVVRVYATQSTHKSLTSLRQGSMILCNDEFFESKVHTAFKEAYYTHMSTSPNYQILASMDMGRVQVDLEGYRLLQRQIEAALRIRLMTNASSDISKYLRFLGPAEMIPAEFRSDEHSTPVAKISDGFIFDLEYMENSWLSDDFFVLDPTRLTLFTGAAGIDGDTFKVDWLMNKYGIQVNKTSRNSVLFQTNIGTDRSSCMYLIQCLERASFEIEALNRLRSRREEELDELHVSSLTVQCPSLPSVPFFYEELTSYLPKNKVPDSFQCFVCDGDIRTPYFLAYNDENCIFLSLDEAIKKLRKGEKLVCSTFIIPYPPGFPIAVPGQLLSEDIIEYMMQLDVKEIHGYEPDLGLRCFDLKVLKMKEKNLVKSCSDASSAETCAKSEKSSDAKDDACSALIEWGSDCDAEHD